MSKSDDDLRTIFNDAWNAQPYEAALHDKHMRECERAAIRAVYEAGRADTTQPPTKGKATRMPFKANRYLLIEVGENRVPKVRLSTDDLDEAKTMKNKSGRDVFIIDTETGDIVG